MCRLRRKARDVECLCGGIFCWRHSTSRTQYYERTWERETGGEERREDLINQSSLRALREDKPPKFSAGAGQERRIKKKLAGQMGPTGIEMGPV